MSVQVPDACTLPTAEQPLRTAEFQALCTASLRTQERPAPQHLRLILAGGDDLMAAVRDLVARESKCCSFFDFAVTSAVDVVILDVEVPAAQADVLDGLSALATTSAAR